MDAGDGMVCRISNAITHPARVLGSHGQRLHNQAESTQQCDGGVMARTQQINPRISAMARDLLQQACEARGCSQSDLVESALTAFLTQTGEGEHQTLVLQQLTVLEETLTGIVGLLQTVIARLEGQVSAPEPEKPPIATYEQMYGPIEAAPQPFIGVETPWEPPQQSRPGRLRRWFVREAL